MTNPLQKWLVDTGLSQTEFAERLARTTGRKTVPASAINRYCLGKVMPRPSIRLAIEKASKGKVPKEAWEKTES